MVILESPITRPAEGILPEALDTMPDVALKTLHINLSELIRHLPGKHATFASTPLADMVRFQDQDDA